VDANPISSILQIAGGYALSRCLHVVADLGVADALNDTPRTAADLAASVGADGDALGRALRLLAAHDVFEFDGAAFRHSDASRLLRTDHPQSLRAIARMFGLPLCWTTFGAIGETLATGQPAADKSYPGGFWAYLSDTPDASTIFNAAMAGKAHGQVAGVVATYDFSGFRRIGDVGGGRGHLLRAILSASPQATGVLFDLPHVVAEAPATERMTTQGGSFFEDSLPSCDAYVLMEVIHDWGDDESVAILRAIRRAASPDAKLLLIEQIVPESPGPDWTKTLDIHMLTLLGGRQRTREEYGSLLERSGFSLQRVIDTPAGVSILEATLAEPGAGDRRSP
jgi:hypothetical protein